jgi:hypothetical protein
MLSISCCRDVDVRLHPGVRALAPPVTGQSEPACTPAITCACGCSVVDLLKNDAAKHSWRKSPTRLTSRLSAQRAARASKIAYATLMQPLPLAHKRPVGLGVSCSPLQAKAVPCRPLLQRVRRCAVAAAGSGALTPSPTHNDGRQQQRGDLQVRLVTERTVHYGTRPSECCMDT